MALQEPAAPAGLLGAAHAGYAFRSHSDGRRHGAAGAISVDVPLPLFDTRPLSLRPELLVLAFSGSEAAPSSLALFAGALSLAYRVDDSDVEAVLAAGPLAGLVVDGADSPTWAGALVSLGLRGAVFPGVLLDARVASPLLVLGPSGASPPGAELLPDGTVVPLPLQVTFTLGVAVDPVALFASSSSSPVP